MFLVLCANELSSSDSLSPISQPSFQNRIDQAVLAFQGYTTMWENMLINRGRYHGFLTIASKLTKLPELYSSIHFISSLYLSWLANYDKILSLNPQNPDCDILLKSLINGLDEFTAHLDMFHPCDAKSMFMLRLLSKNITMGSRVSLKDPQKTTLKFDIDSLIAEMATTCQSDPYVLDLYMNLEMLKILGLDFIYATPAKAKPHLVNMHVSLPGNGRNFRQVTDVVFYNTKKSCEQPQTEPWDIVVSTHIRKAILTYAQQAIGTYNEGKLCALTQGQIVFKLTQFIDEFVRKYSPQSRSFWERWQTLVMIAVNKALEDLRASPLVTIVTSADKPEMKIAPKVDTTQKKRADKKKKRPAQSATVSKDESLKEDETGKGVADQTPVSETHTEEVEISPSSSDVPLASETIPELDAEGQQPWLQYQGKEPSSSSAAPSDVLKPESQKTRFARKDLKREGADLRRTAGVSERAPGYPVYELLSDLGKKVETEALTARLNRIGAHWEGNGGSAFSVVLRDGKRLNAHIPHGKGMPHGNELPFVVRLIIIGFLNVNGVFDLEY